MAASRYNVLVQRPILRGLIVLAAVTAALGLSSWTASWLMLAWSGPSIVTALGARRLPVAWSGRARMSAALVVIGHGLRHRSGVRPLPAFREWTSNRTSSSTRMGIAWSEGVVKRGMSLERFVEVTSSNAARLFGLYPAKGAIAAGSAVSGMGAYAASKFAQVGLA